MKKNEVKKLHSGNIVVQRYHMLPTPKPGEPYQWIYTAWEKVEGIFDKRHHSLTTFDGQWYGKIGTDPDPDRFDHLPVGPERTEALHEEYRRRAWIACEYIYDAFPETRGHWADGFGEISIIEYRDPFKSLGDAIQDFRASINGGRI